MAELKRVFLKGKMNKDIDERYLQDGDFSHAENIRVASPAEGDVGVVKNLPSTGKVDSLSALLSNDTNVVCLSTAVDESTQNIYLFIKSAQRDAIIEVKTQDTPITSSFIINDTNNLLNFGNEYFAKGVVLDGFLMWTDNTNPPCKINIERIRNKTLNQLTTEDIYLIKKPPIKEPEFTYNYTDVLVNKFEDALLKFSYRYVYDDGEKSSMSFLSKTTKLNKVPSNSLFLEYLRVFSFYKYTSIGLTFDVGNERVKEIEILVKDINSNNMYINTVVNKSRLGLQSSTDIEKKYYTLTIESPKEGAVLPEQESLKQFDNVPLKAKEISLVDSRIFFADYEEGLPLKSNGLDIIEDVTVTESYIPLNDGDFTLVSPEEINYTTPNKNISFDFSARTFTTNDYITATFYTWKSGSLGFLEYDKIISVTHFVNGNYNSFSAFYAGDVSFQQKIQSAFAGKVNINTPSIVGNKLIITTTDSVAHFSGTMSKESNKISYHHEVPYSYGIVYYDDYNRSSTVLPIKDSAIFLHQSLKQDSSLNRVNIKINHTPPEWSKKFKVVRKAYERDNDLMTLGYRKDTSTGSPAFYILTEKTGGINSTDATSKLYDGMVLDIYGGQYMGFFGTLFVQGGTEGNKIARKLFRYKVNKITVKEDPFYSSSNIHLLEGFFIKGTESELLELEHTVVTQGTITYYYQFQGEVVKSSVLKPNYYEIPETFYISNGYHVGNGSNAINQTSSVPFEVNLLDGDSLVDNFGRFEFKSSNLFNGNKFDSIDSLRPNNVVSTSETQKRYASITHSGKYVKESSLNELNSFNLATANFEDFDKNNGAIIKLHPREGDMVVLQENGISKILVSKDALYGGDGKPTISVIESVLGQKVVYPYRNGISNNPESFDFDSSIMYFSDANRGVILAMEGDQLLEISNTGMSGFFKGLFKKGVDYVKGAYDKTNDEYVISIKQTIEKRVLTNDEKKYARVVVIAENGCNPLLNIYELYYTLGFNKGVKGWVSFYSYYPEQLINVNNRLFTNKKETTGISIFEHNSNLSLRNNIHNTNVLSKIITYFNEEPETNKIPKYLEIDSNVPFDVKVSADGKFSNILDSEFVNKEGSWFAYLRRSEYEDTEDGNNYKGIGRFSSYSNGVFTFQGNIGSHLSIGDSLYAFINNEVRLLGVIIGRTSNTITIQEEETYSTSPVLTVGQVTSNSVTLDWIDADGIGVTGYRIYNSDNELLVDLGVVLSYTFTGLTTDTEYSYKVVATNADCEEFEFSNIVTATTSVLDCNLSGNAVVIDITTTTTTIAPTTTTTVAPVLDCNLSGNAVVIDITTTTTTIAPTTTTTVAPVLDCSLSGNADEVTTNTYTT